MTTATISVAAGDDDFFEDGGSNISSFSDLLYAGNYSGANSEHLMMRFAVALTAANTINSATWRLYAPGGTQTGAPQLIAYGDDVDNSADRTGALVNSRTKTTASTVVNIGSGTFSSAGWLEIDVKSIVEEILARGGWSSGNYIGLMLINQLSTSTNEVGIEDLAAAGTNEGELVIVYDEATGTDIAGALEAISLTTFAAAVALAGAISGALESISVSTLPATVASANSVAAALESISVATSAATVAGIPVPPDITTYQLVTIGTPDGAAANRITATGDGDIEAGDIVAWGDIAGIGDVTVYDNGTFDADLFVTSFDVQVWDGAAWGTVGLQTVDTSQALESISLTTFPATIAASFNIAAALEAISVATFQAQVLSSAQIQGALESISLATFGATVSGSGSPVGVVSGAIVGPVVAPVIRKPYSRVVRSWRKPRF